MAEQLLDQRFEMNDPDSLKLMRKMSHFDTLCFKHCVKVPDRTLTDDQEKCLSNISFIF
jgi:hypothetical protein